MKNLSSFPSRKLIRFFGSRENKIFRVCFLFEYLIIPLFVALFRLFSVRDELGSRDMKIFANNLFILGKYILNQITLFFIYLFWNTIIIRFHAHISRHGSTENIMVNLLIRSINTLILQPPNSITTNAIDLIDCQHFN